MSRARVSYQILRAGHIAFLKLSVSHHSMHTFLNPPHTGAGICKDSKGPLSWLVQKLTSCFLHPQNTFERHFAAIQAVPISFSSWLSFTSVHSQNSDSGWLRSCLINLGGISAVASYPNIHSSIVRLTSYVNTQCEGEKLYISSNPRISPRLQYSGSHEVPYR